MTVVQGDYLAVDFWTKFRRIQVLRREGTLENCRVCGRHKFILDCGLSSIHPIQRSCKFNE